ncbi:hypothetical protein C8R44DRAFT_731705 [Mycena epipterygia]|nr:hypothetical protein C8R44DRAFT_731705 [Mycena epipterygia]
MHLGGNAKLDRGSCIPPLRTWNQPRDAQRYSHSTLTRSKYNYESAESRSLAKAKNARRRMDPHARWSPAVPVFVLRLRPPAPSPPCLTPTSSRYESYAYAPSLQSPTGASRCSPTNLLKIRLLSSESRSQGSRVKDDIARVLNQHLPTPSPPSYLCINYARPLALSTQSNQTTRTNLRPSRARPPTPFAGEDMLRRITSKPIALQVACQLDNGEWEVWGRSNVHLRK